MSIFKSDLFANRVALVTGGGTGIGKCIATELASLGCFVVIAGRRLDKVQATAKVINEALAKHLGSSCGERVEGISLNIRDEVAVEETVKALVNKYGRIHYLVNNAGGQFTSPASDIKPKGWRAVVDTNLNGTWWVTQAVYHATKPEGADLFHDLAIVNVVADMFNGFPMMAHTGAARAAVVNLTQTLAVEWGSAGVRVNAVAPGVILSDGVSMYPPAFQPVFVETARQCPLGRGGTESETAASVVFLLSPAAVYITGATLRVDGGSSLFKKGFTAGFGKGLVPPFHLSPDFASNYNDIIASKTHAKLPSKL